MSKQTPNPSEVIVEKIWPAIASCCDCDGRGRVGYRDADSVRRTRPCRTCHGTGTVISKSKLVSIINEAFEEKSNE